MGNVLSLRKPQTSRLECSRCGTGIDAGCSCGVPYIPKKPLARAADAIAARPERSNRAIAEEIGVAEDTIRRARKTGARNRAPAKRTGRDGKSYPALTSPRKLPNNRSPLSKLGLELFNFKVRFVREAKRVIGAGGYSDEARDTLIDVLRNTIKECEELVSSLGD